MGIFKYDPNEIIFNQDWILRSHWTEVIVTAFHEMRHAYKGYCIRTRSRESQKTLEKWEYETLNYIMPSEKNNEIDDEAYLNQDIEIDAIAFAHCQMYKLFNVKSVIPNVIKDKVNYRCNCIKGGK